METTESVSWLVKDDRIREWIIQNLTGPHSIPQESLRSQKHDDHFFHWFKIERRLTHKEINKSRRFSRQQAIIGENGLFCNGTYCGRHVCPQIPSERVCDWMISHIRSHLKHGVKAYLGVITLTLFQREEGIKMWHSVTMKNRILTWQKAVFFFWVVIY